MSSEHEKLIPEEFSTLWARRVLKRTGLHTNRDLDLPLTHVQEALDKVFKKLSLEISPSLLKEEFVINHFSQYIKNRAQKTKKGDSLGFTLWALTPKSADELYGSFKNFLEKERGKRVGMLGETRDGLFELVQIYHEPLFYKVAQEQKSCITDPKYDWLGRTRISDKQPRAKVELLVLRAKKSLDMHFPGRPEKTSMPPGHSIATFSYYPKEGRIGQIEGAKARGRTQEIVFLNSRHPAFKPVCELVGKMVRNEIPGVTLKERVSPLDSALNEVMATDMALLDTGEYAQITNADPEKIILTNYMRITRETPPHLLEVACKTARTLDMTYATTEQKSTVTAVNGALIDAATGHLSYPKLTRVVGGIAMAHAFSATFPFLKQALAERLSFPKINVLEAPLWTDFKGTLVIPRGARINAPFMSNVTLKIERP